MSGWIYTSFHIAGNTLPFQVLCKHQQQQAHSQLSTADSTPNILHHHTADPLDDK